MDHDEQRSATRHHFEAGSRVQEATIEGTPWLNRKLLILGCCSWFASVVAIASRRIGLPYTAGLVLAGIALAFLPIGAGLPLTRELIFNLFLPPLIFEAALQLKWRQFRAQTLLTVVLAFAGVAISAAVVAMGMHLLLGWGLLGSAFFGVLIAANDPVSVIAAFKEMNAEPRLRLVVESETLLNDGVAAVAFAALVGIAGGGVFTPVGAAGHLEEPSDYVLMDAGEGSSGRVVPIPMHRSADFLDGADRWVRFSCYAGAARPSSHVRRWKL